MQIERRRGQRPGYHGQGPVKHNEWHRGQRPELKPGFTDVPLHHKRPTFALFGAFILRQPAEQQL